MKMKDGRWWYPTAEEAEFTADLCFYLAVAMSHWAVRVGRAKLRLPRFSVVPQETGDRVAWLKFPAETLREEAMPSCGLPAAGPSASSGPLPWIAHPALR